MSVTFPETPQIVTSEEYVPCYQEMHHLTAVGSHGRAPGKLYYPKGVAIDPRTNQIYVAEGGKCMSRVSIFSELGEFLYLFSLCRMRNPYGIAIHTDNIFFTDLENHRLFQFQLTIDKICLIKSVGGYGSVFGKFNSPRQLSVSSNGDVFVADYSNHRIQILDCYLNYQRHISHHTMTHPCDVKLTPDLVYVLSYDPSCVHIFSYAGKKLRSLITLGCGVGLYIPGFFCLDSNENLVVSDWEDHVVKIFSKDGTLLHVLGKEGHQIDTFDRPHGVALTNNLKLVVLSYNKKYGLQIFS